MSQKAKDCKSIKEELKKKWIHRVSSNSLDGPFMKMETSVMNYRQPSQDEWKKLQRATAMEMPVSFDDKAEEIMRTM